MKRLIFLTILILAATSCKKRSVTTHSGSEHGDTLARDIPPDLIPAEIRGVKLYLEIAATPDKRQLGLMFRDSLPQNQGMLFVFEREQPLGFWMKNTKIPLSIAFLDRNYVIVDIQDMEPFSEKTHVSARPAMYALEVNQGFFRQHNITVGDTLKLLLPK